LSPATGAHPGEADTEQRERGGLGNGGFGSWSRKVTNRGYALAKNVVGTIDSEAEHIASGNGERGAARGAVGICEEREASVQEVH
jgi:hypothetical protein